VNDIPLDRRHRLQLDPLTRRDRAFGAPNRKRVERRFAPLAVPRRVDHDRLPILGLA
jgi:hypothetical protein